MYKHNIEARSYNHSYSVKAVMIAYCNCLSLALGIQQRHLWPALLNNMFPHYLTIGTI